MRELQKFKGGNAEDLIQKPLEAKGTRQNKLGFRWHSIEPTSKKESLPIYSDTIK